MKAYWDSSALMEAIKDPVLRTRLRDEKGVTRTHALSETFSTLTGNPKDRTETGQAVQAIEQLMEDLDSPTCPRAR